LPSKYRSEGDYPARLSGNVNEADNDRAAWVVCLLAWYCFSFQGEAPREALSLGIDPAWASFRGDLVTVFRSVQKERKMRLTLALSVLFLACLAEAQTGSKPTTADDSDLKSTEQQWVDAYYRGEGKTLSRIEADDFTVIANGQKPQTKAEQIAEVEGRGPVGVPAPNVEEEIRHYGDVAVIVGLSGSSSVRFTAVWVKLSGQWKVVHLHYSQGD
jgi:ketosteroid isomerase-like protein